MFGFSIVKPPFSFTRFVKSMFKKSKYIYKSVCQLLPAKNEQKAYIMKVNFNSLSLRSSPRKGEGGGRGFEGASP